MPVSQSFLILLALAISTFCIGSAEFVMAGALPEITQAFDVNIPTAGWTVTGYALGVMKKEFSIILGEKHAHRGRYKHG